MSILDYFCKEKPTIFDNIPINLSKHTFTQEEKAYLCNFSDVFRVEIKQICSLFSINPETFKSWKKRSSSTMNPLTILTAKNQNSEAVENLTVHRRSNKKDVAIQTIYPTRKIHFCDYEPKYRSAILDELFQYLFHSPFLMGFGKVDREKAIVAFALKFSKRNADSSLLDSLFATFKTAIISAIKKKETDLLSQLLSLLFPSFTLKEIQQRVYPITSYNWNKAHRHLLSFGEGGLPVKIFTRSYSSVVLSR